MVSASRIQIPTLLYGVIPWPHLPIADLPAAAKAPWRSFGRESHEWLAYGAYALVALHVAGALKHQLLDRDMPILARMAPGAKPRAWFDPRLLAVGLGAIVVIAAGELIRPALPAAAPLAPASAVAEEDHVAPAPAAPATASAVPATPAAAASPAMAPPAGPSHWAVGKGSSLGFATSWSGQAIQGRFDKWTADILFSPGALDKSKVSVSIDLASANTGDPQRDQSLPTSDWFDAATHPKATFVADRFEQTGDGRYVAHGKLTLRGVTKPVDLPFRLKIDADKARMSGVTSLDRTAFGVGQGDWQATDQIPGKVQVSVQITATRR
jgi:polyisoprenoid-binding protein YceI